MPDNKQLLWNKSIDMLTVTTVFNEGNGVSIVSIDNRVINVVFGLLQQLQQAHRQGWEQGKREAVARINSTDLEWRWSLAEFIAAMEYKEKAND